MRLSSIFVSLLVLVLLAACGPHRVSPEPEPGLASITLSASFGDEMASQGLPFNDQGQSAVNYLRVEVWKGSERISFDEGGVYTLEGGNTAIVINGVSSSVTIKLPTGSGYTFQTQGYTHEGGSFLAYGETSTNITHQTSIVPLKISTLIGSVVLDTSAPISYVVPGQVLDLYLSVITPAGNFRVPTSDYNVSYDLHSSMGILVGSKRGARVNVTPTAQENDFTMSATVSGWMSMSGSPQSGQPAPASFNKPFLQETGTSVDSEAPMVTFDGPSSLVTNSANTLSGTAWDNVGLDKLQVYEGPVLIGSSHSSEYGGSVGQVTFSGNGWSLNWTPPADGTYTLKAVAIDSSGNEAEASVSLTASSPSADTTAPQVSFSQTWYYYGDEVSGWVSDADSGIAKVELYAKPHGTDDSYYMLVRSSESGNLAIIGDTWTIGSYYGSVDWWEDLKVVVYDSAGNTSAAYAYFDSGYIIW